MDVISSARIEVNGLWKEYDLRPVLRDVSVSLVTGDVLGVTGRNGSGKSTFMKIAANVLSKSRGEITWMLSNTKLTDEQLPGHTGYVAPYLQLYTEFSILELLDILGKMRGLAPDIEYAKELCSRFSVEHRMTDPLSAFSSGMLQRARFIIALAHHPTFLFLDEPMSNLDVDGIATVRQIVQEERDERITLIATNDHDDLSLCTTFLDVQHSSSLADPLLQP